MSKKTWRYRLYAIGFGIFILVCLELTLRLFGVADGQDYIPPRLVKVVKQGKLQGEFVQSNVPYFEQKGQLVETHPQYRKGQAMGFPASGSMRHLRFSKAPDANVERYFLLGGSAALGQHPVDLKIKSTWQTQALGKGVSALPEELSISGQLEHILKQKGKQVEVLNAGMIAQDSGGVRRIALEVLQFKPTGILLYLGNNESIGMAYGMQGEQLPIVPEVRNALRNIRLYRLISDKVIPARQRHSKAPPKLQGTKPEVLGQLTQTQWRAAGEPLVAGEQANDSVYTALQKRFQENLKIIIDAANKVGVAVYIIPTAPNLNYPPFYDANSPILTENDIQQYTNLLGQAKQAERQRDWDNMITILNQAVGVEESHATSWYMLGTALNHTKQYQEALRAREKSLMLDLSRKRALPVYNSVVQKLCSNSNCSENNAHNVIRTRVEEEGLSIYDQLWGDHEHLTPEGCTIIANLFADIIP
jgi:tetratricopeptide (TPR) repeat protein